MCSLLRAPSVELYGLVVFDESHKPSARGESDPTVRGTARYRSAGALAMLRLEPELAAPGEITFQAHALVVPSSHPGDKKGRDRAHEAIAVKVSEAWEGAEGAEVWDVSTSELARTAGLVERLGFDLLSLGPDGDELAIKVKGRAGIGDIELTENEWAKAWNLRDR